MVGCVADNEKMKVEEPMVGRFCIIKPGTARSNFGREYDVKWIIGSCAQNIDHGPWTMAVTR